MDGFVLAASNTNFNKQDRITSLIPKLKFRERDKPMQIVSIDDREENSANWCLQLLSLTTKIKERADSNNE
ncbi:hypothetical protein BpHYR1_027327 [Brachionus plicatilis]|uniref:Uncharacterized protein n=1 Tax=Brachionus plicatilis TaxID=10195 RepID=A0A3M7P6I8_BRAPC|nr:hypothetical protein BpHYR1_027327 [Brachionus plicatilis]